MKSKLCLGTHLFQSISLKGQTSHSLTRQWESASQEDYLPLLLAHPRPPKVTKLRISCHNIFPSNSKSSVGKNQMKGPHSSLALSPSPEGLSQAAPYNTISTLCGLPGFQPGAWASPPSPGWGQASYLQLSALPAAKLESSCKFSLSASPKELPVICLASRHWFQLCLSLK